MRRTARSPQRPALLTAGLLGTFILSACAGSGASASPTPDDQIGHPEGDELVLRVEYAGGMVANSHITNIPTFSMTGDGRVIVLGAQIDLFPGPALPPVLVRKLSEAGVQAVLQAVAASRQFASSVEWRGAQNFVADAANTVFTLHADGRDVVVDVYGLGTFADGQQPPNVPASEVAAHKALVTLNDRLTTLEQWLPADSWVDPAWDSYAAESLRLLLRNADADPPDDTGIGNTLIEWPVAGDAEAFGRPTSLDGYRCGVVSGEDAQAWYEVLESANQMTRWVSGEHRYEVTVRPLMPDEAKDCPATWGYRIASRHRLAPDGAIGTIRPVPPPA
jgi:hypothetical protein